MYRCAGGSFSWEGINIKEVLHMLLLLLLFHVVLQPNVGYGLLIHEVFEITHDAPQSVGLLWTSD
jgi:hypothetical protein